MAFLTCIPESARMSLAVSAFYAGSSVTLSMLNKALLSSYHFEGYFTLLFTQLMLSYCFCVISRDYFGNPFSIPHWSKDALRAALPMGVMYVLNVGVGLAGLKMVNVPMFFALRRLVAPMVLIYEYFSMGKVADTGVQMSVGVIVMGTILAGWDTFGDDFWGYLITMLNNLLTAAASVMQKQFSDSTKLTTFGIVYFNACIAAPLALLLILVTGELPEIMSFPHLYDMSFWVGFMIASCMGLVLTYSSLLSTTYNSPLATSVTGNAKDILTTAIGWVAFSGFKATAKSVGGIVLSFIGAFLYSYVNLMKMKANAAGKPAAVGTAAARPEVHAKHDVDDEEATEANGLLPESPNSDHARARRQV